MSTTDPTEVPGPSDLDKLIYRDAGVHRSYIKVMEALALLAVVESQETDPDLLAKVKDFRSRLAGYEPLMRNLAQSYDGAVSKKALEKGK